MNFFQTVVNWLTRFWTWIEAACGWLLDGILHIFKFVLYTVFDGMLVVIEAAINAVDFSSVAFAHAANWANLPTQAIWLITALGLPQCIAMLGAAYLVRLGLNLIPSWATRA